MVRWDYFPSTLEEVVCHLLVLLLNPFIRLIHRDNVLSKPTEHIWPHPQELATSPFLVVFVIFILIGTVPAAFILRAILKKFDTHGFLEEFSFGRSSGNLPPFRWILSCDSAGQAKCPENEFGEKPRDDKTCESVTVQGKAVAAVANAHMVLMGCKPDEYKDMLGQEGMTVALSGKFLISIVDDLSTEDLQTALYVDCEAAVKK